MKKGRLPIWPQSAGSAVAKHLARKINVVVVLMPSRTYGVRIARLSAHLCGRDAVLLCARITNGY